MKQLCKNLLTAMTVGMILPGILMNGAVFYLRKQPKPMPDAVKPKTYRETVRFRNPGGNIGEMEMDTYLTGVLLAEMPASFEEEALKAQAVAARTYTRKAAVTGGKHEDGSVCADASCCQGYCDPQQYLSLGNDAASVEKVRRAVEDTSGFVLLYGGELIEATYFSCSGGATEDAAAVWGGEFPYLQSVPSPGEEGAAVYTQTVMFTPSEFQEALGVTLSGNPRDWFTVTTYTEGNGVASMIIGGKTYSGTQLRSLLGLRSTAFTVDATANQITVTTKGYGHRVGLSQYGADAMAVDGNSYQQILAHYYPGTMLVWQEEIKPAA